MTIQITDAEALLILAMVRKVRIERDYPLALSVIDKINKAVVEEKEGKNDT